MTYKKLRLYYSHSKFWLIFWMLIYFPIGIVLLLNHTKMISGTRKIEMEYDGCRFWLFFWALFFFPFVILLLLFNGAFVEHFYQIYNK